MTGLKEKIILLLADFPEKEFYGEEIARRIKCSKASASNLLKSLSKSGLTSRQERGHMKFYRINPRSAEVKALKINTVIGQIKPILPKLAKFSDRIILFGSASRGEQTSGSDLDLFIIARNKNNIRKILEKFEAMLPIKAIIKTFAEWSEMEIREPEFFWEVKSGITLHEYVPRI